MSARITDVVWRKSKAKGSTLLVLLAVADFADDHGNCWPTVERLANKTGLTRRAVQRHLQELARMNEIVPAGVALL